MTPKTRGDGGVLQQRDLHAHQRRHRRGKACGSTTCASVGEPSPTARAASAWPTGTALMPDRSTWRRMSTCRGSAQRPPPRRRRSLRMSPHDVHPVELDADLGAGNPGRTRAGSEAECSAPASRRRQRGLSEHPDRPHAHRCQHGAGNSNDSTPEDEEQQGRCGRMPRGRRSQLSIRTLTGHRLSGCRVRGRDVAGVGEDHPGNHGLSCPWVQFRRLPVSRAPDLPSVLSNASAQSPLSKDFCRVSLIHSHISGYCLGVTDPDALLGELVADHLQLALVLRRGAPAG